MTRLVTLATLRGGIQRRGGVENSADLTPVVLNEIVNEGIAELWDILKSKRDDRLITSTVLPTVVGTASVTLPADFYELRNLLIADSNAPSGFTRLRAVALEVAHQYYRLYGRKYRYRLQGNLLFLHPTPQAIESLTVFYLPATPVLVLDADTFDGISGYEELITALGWRRCLVRQNLSTNDMDNEVGRLCKRISSAAAARDDEPFSLDPRGAGYGAYGDDEGEYY